MQRKKLGGKRLLKKTHFTKDSVRRWLSLALSLCMVVSLFSGIIAFPAFAQQLALGDEQTEPQENAQVKQRAETMKEIKARLLRQIREEGWDPYNSDMSLDEFYALMELFQEGILPLDEEGPVVEIIDPDDGEPDEENDPGEEAADPDNGGPDAEDPGAEEPAVEEPAIEEPKAEEPKAEKPGVDDPYTVGPDTANPTPVDPTPAVPTPAVPTPADPAPVDPTPADPMPTDPAPAPSAPVLDDPNKTDGESEPVSVPRTMFLFSGVYAEDVTETDGTVHEKSTPGTDVSGHTHGSPLKYDNEDGHIKTEGNGNNVTDEDDYKAGLDTHGLGYTRPPKSWEGVVTDTDDDMRALVIVPNINAGEPHIASDVDQNLFLRYNGYYVYRVTAQNNDVTVLGAIPMGDSYVYYYTNYLLQDTTVSATTLPDGEKFVIEYVPNEYTIEYKVLMAGNETTGGSGDSVTKDQIIQWIQANWTDSSVSRPNANITDVTAKYREAVYGTYLPSQSELGAYAFTAKAPDGYTLSFYMVKGDEYNVWEKPVLQLATKNERKQMDENDPALYKVVNSGWALGEEPEYTVKVDYKIISDLTTCPEYLTLNGTFYNNTLDANRLIIAVLRKKPDPEFNAGTIIEKSTGTSNRAASAVRYLDNLKIRETGEPAGRVPYDYEDEYLYRTNQDSKYTGYNNNNPLGNVIPYNNQWDWQNTKYSEVTKSAMERQADGTYSFQWTFQTNSGNGAPFLMDVLEINRVGIQIPFYTRYEVNEAGSKHGEYRGNGRDNKNDSGLYAWSTTTTLLDGAEVQVEYLMIFGGQRVYRITVTGARNNVTVTALNLHMYESGAPEFSTYDLDGITGATSNGLNDLRLAAIQFYNKTTDDKNNKIGWGSSRAKYDTTQNINRGNVVINLIDYGGTDGLTGGDESNGGANFRFKLADGYANPYYLYESARDGVIAGALSENDLQASVTRDRDTGEVMRGTRNDVVPYISNGDDPYMAYYIEDPTQANGIRFVHPLDLDDDLTEDDFVRAQPIPVALVDGEYKPLYDGNGKLYTDWAMIQINIVSDGSGGTRQELYPVLYDSPGGDTPLEIKDVVADWGEYVFQEKDRLMKSQYVYRGAANGGVEDDSYWYYIRVSGQGKWVKGNYDEQYGVNAEGYHMALLTIVAYPMRYMVRYKPGTIEPYRSETGEVLAGERTPLDMPIWDHNHDGKADGNPLNDADCPAFPLGHIHDDGKPHHEFEDDEGRFYNVESNYDIALVSVTPRDPDGYSEFQGWKLVDANDEQVYAHVIGENGQWLRDANGAYVYTPVTFSSGRRIDLRDYAEFAIENGTLGGDNNDIYVLRLMPLWEKIDSPYRYNVALNWVDVEGTVHLKYFSDYWPEIVTSFAPGEDGNELVVKVLTESTPFRNWLALNGTFAYWDVVNNAENDTVVADALKAYYTDKVSGWDENSTADQAKFDAALKDLKKMYVEGSTTGRAEFGRMGNYTYTVTEDGGTIIIWMQEIYGALEFHKKVEAEPFIIDDEYYFTVEGDSIADGIYYAYPDKADVLAKEGWEVEFKDGRIANIKQYDDAVAWPEDPVTYFTLHDGDGVTLYVPDGEYTIRELGSKSGGSYQAEVKYEDRMAPANKAGDTWVLPKPEGGDGSLWLKGSEREYRDGNTNEAISQLSATGGVKAGSKNEVRTIMFYSRTSTVAFEKTVAGPYYTGDQFGFKVSLILPEDASPLIDDSRDSRNGSNGADYYYFNFNLYDVEYEPGTEPSEKPDNEGKDWRPDGTLKAVATGRMVVKPAVESDGSTTWVSDHLLVQERVWYESVQKWLDTWVQRKDKGIWLEADQRFYVVCTVPQQGSPNYTIEETDFKGYRVVGDSSGSGTVEPADLAYEWFVNSMLVVLPSTGGAGGRMVLISGAVFLMSTLGLAWLNRDLLRKRRRHFEV